MRPIQIFISMMILAYASITLKSQTTGDTVRITYKGKGVTVRPQGDESNTTIRFKDTQTRKDIVVKVSMKDLDGNEADVDDNLDSTLKKTFNALSKKSGKDNKRHFIEKHFLPNFDIGFVSTDNEAVNNYTYNPRFTKSANINLGLCKFDLNLYKSRLLFSCGIGLNKYYLKYNKRQNMQYIDKLGYLNSFTDTVNTLRKNRVDVFYLTVPVLLEYHSKGDDFNIAAGVEYGFNQNTHFVTKGSRESMDFEHHEDANIKINPNQINAVLRVGFDHLAVYGRYSLTDMYQESAYAPNTNPHQHLFSVGICLFGI